MGELANFGRELNELITKPQTGIGKIVQDWTEETILLLKEEAPRGSGALANSFQPEYKLEEGLMEVKFYANAYWDFINSGVDGTERGGQARKNSEGVTYSFKNEFVSRSFINQLTGAQGLGWIASKGLTAEDGDYVSLAFAISKALKKKGIKANQYMERVFSEERLQELEDRILDFIQNKI